MKRLAILWITALLLLAPAASLAQGRGYETMEECAQALFAALKAQDVEAMEACVAFDELAGSYDARVQAERLQAVTSYASFLPATDPFSIAYNAAQLRRGWYLKAAKITAMAADPQMAEALFSGMNYPAGTDEYAMILEALDTLDSDNVLEGLTYQGIVTPEEIPAVADLYANEKIRNNLDRTMAVWGIDTCAEIAIVVSRRGLSLFAAETTYIIPLRMVEIDGRWLADPNMAILGMLLGMNVTDFAIEMPQ